MKIQDVLKLCKEFETKLNGKFHVGLTGSCLYGDQEKAEDIDLIIYPHTFEDMVEAKFNLAEIVETLGLERTNEAGPSAAHSVYVTTYNGIKIDLFSMLKENSPR
jgi:predicted nucleotidyltransferase